MYSFKEFLSKDTFILTLTNLHFNSSINEAADTAIVYYEKDPQVIMISQHGLEDGKKRGRLWWDDENHLKDPKFTDFADKCLVRILDPLDDYENEYVDSFSNEKKKVNIHLDKEANNEMGFCDLNKEKGWVVRLNKSKDGQVTSFTIITVLYMPVMNKKAPLFVKPDTYIINIDKPKPQSKMDKFKSEYEEIDGKIKDLTDKHEIAYIEADDMPEGKEKSIALKNANKIQDQIQNLKNRKDKLKSLLSITESVTVTEKLTNRKMRFIMV